MDARLSWARNALWGVNDLQESLVEWLSDPDDPDQRVVVAQVSRVIAEMRKRLSDVHQMLDDFLIEAADGRPGDLSLANGGMVTVEPPSTSRSWQSDDLLREVVRRVFDPEGTGVLDDAAIAAIDQLVPVLATVLSMSRSTPWKVTGLKDLGIDPDEYAEKRVGRNRVKVMTVLPEGVLDV
jgi:hypothetical protein